MKLSYKKTSFFFLTLQLLFPLVSEARTLRSIAEGIAKFLSVTVVQFLIVLALVLFFWGVIEFIRNADNPDARKKGKQHMVWGIIGLFFMLTFLSVTGILTRTFFGGNPILPLFYE